MPANSVDFILTDPPYLVNYRDRTGRTIHNDVDESWLKPAMAQAYRVLKQDRVAVMFYSWTKIDRFFEAWLGAGFQPVGHIVFRKSYSSKSRFLRYQHEQAFLLAKGRPPPLKQPLGDVIDMPYSGNKLHPTQKPIPALVSLIRSFPFRARPSSIHSQEVEAPVRQHFSRVASTSAWRWMTHTFISLQNAFREFTREPLQGWSHSFAAVDELLSD